jgi:hypothetical protein
VTVGRASATIDGGICGFQTRVVGLGDDAVDALAIETYCPA